jgi:3-phosphoshikimate 1-carboxyvinyltransferase
MSKPSVSKIHVDPSHLVPASLTPPVSKSDAQRALVLAHLTGHWPLAVLQNEPEADLAADVRVLTRGVEALRLPPGPVQDVDCADGGAPFRIFVTQAAVTPGAKVRITGTPRLGERPHGPLFDSLREALGPSGLVLNEGKPWPVELHAPARTGEPVFRVPGAQSSQYASSLLLGCAALFLREKRPWSVEIQGPLTSAGYLELTVSWMRRFGFTVEETPSRFTVTAHQPSKSAPPMPGDWSSLGYLLLIAWRTGGSVERADPSSAHPDQAILRLIQPAGLTPVPGSDLTMRVEGQARDGLTASGKECPDLLPTLAALACVLPRPSTLHDVSILRLKESDRLEGIRTLVSAYGGNTTLEGETLTITPPAAPPAHFEMDSRGDHRLAMVSATLSILSGARLTLTGPECVEKSFPGFWRQVERVGVRLTE